MNPITHTFHESPIGKLLLRQENAALTGLWITGEAHAPTPAPDWAWSDAGFAPIRAELDAYFAGRLPVFTIPVACTSGTAFQRAVWEELARIPYGHTISYGELGRRIGRPAAVRAIGSANGQNPVSIVIPCHRVIGANGTLTGYGGGLPAKRWLLAHEATHSGAALL